jgi:acyl dehydratase
MSTVPLSLLLEQGPMLNTLARVLLSTAAPQKRPSSNPEHFPLVRRCLPAPSRRLIGHYAAWCGAPRDRYAAILPPHMFTQFALPVWAAQLQMTRYPLLRIINQGCGVSIHQDIAVGAALDVSATVVAIAEKDHRARIHQQLDVKAQNGERALTVDFYTRFILGKRTRQKRSSPQTIPLAAVASWDAHPNDGFRFGVLTGDLNPIHWIGCIARRSPFNGKVMHGFGMFARCFEILQNATERPYNPLMSALCALPGCQAAAFRSCAARSLIPLVTAIWRCWTRRGPF